MLRVVVLFFLFFQVLNGANFTYPDFKQCHTKISKSFVYFGDIRAVAVSKNLAVAYSQTKPKVDFIRFDPFLNLYLFRSKKNHQPVKLRSTHGLKLGEWIAGMDDRSLFVGNFAKSGELLDSFHLQNVKLEPNSIISCLCCEMYGLGVGGGYFIGSELIKRFIASEDIYYGDIGARFERRAGFFTVKSVDPFHPNHSLSVGDIVLAINGQKSTSLKQINQIILFSKLKSKVTLEILRGNQKLKKNLIVHSRSGGGYLSDTFLENRGIFLDEDMKIIKIEQKSFAAQSGLHLGDRLMQIDHKKIENQNEIKEYFSNLKSNEAQLLFERSDFQFFVKIEL
jgi:hypothetical protein